MYEHEYRAALEYVREAGILLGDIGKTERPREEAASRDFVASADRRIYELLFQKLTAAFPDDAVYSEEGGRTHTERERLWVIDPIDGTANFSRGIPHVAVCLGLLISGVPVVGAVYNPFSDECFSFRKGSGAFLNGTSMHVSGEERIERATVLFHAGRKSELREWGARSYEKLLPTARRIGDFSSVSLNLCFLAAGRVDAVVYGSMTTLDAAPALGILAEAGGVASCGASALAFHSTPTHVSAASSRPLLHTLAELLKA